MSLQTVSRSILRSYSLSTSETGHAGCQDRAAFDRVIFLRSIEPSLYRFGQRTWISASRLPDAGNLDILTQSNLSMMFDHRSPMPILFSPSLLALVRTCSLIEQQRSTPLAQEVRDCISAQHVVLTAEY